MTDPKVEERARKLLKPHVFRVGQRRADLGGIRVESSAVDYWEAVHVVADLLTKLDEAEREIEVQRRNALLNYGAYVQAHRRAEAAEERERALIAGVREMLALEPFRFADADDPERNLGDPVLWQSEVVAILSRLLPSTPTEGGTKNDE